MQREPGLDVLDGARVGRDGRGQPAGGDDHRRADGLEDAVDDAVDLTGEAVCAFIVLKGPRPTGAEAHKMAQELRDWVGKEIGAIAKPKDIRFGDNLPKTRSGKIMRRLLRSIARDEPITQDIATLENPAVLDQLLERN